MAAKKATKKKVAKKAQAPAKKSPAKKAAPKVAKKAAKKTAVKAPAKSKTKSPAKKQAPAKKAVAKKAPAKKAQPKAAPAKETAKPASKANTPKKSSLVDYPAPPAPAKKPFVPSKSSAISSSKKAAKASSTHSAAFINKQKQRLLDLRDELVDAMSGMTRDTIRNAPEGSEASGSGQHQGDAGSDAYDRDFALSVLAKEQDALYEIEQALRRIQVGNYGVCEISEQKIPQTRLEAIPFARLTVEMQAEWEKEHGNRRFRPNNEVGFSGGNTFEEDDSDTVSLDEDE